jgi:hypothetical protein
MISAWKADILGENDEDAERSLGANGDHVILD